MSEETHAANSRGASSAASRPAHTRWHVATAFKPNVLPFPEISRTSAPSNAVTREASVTMDRASARAADASGAEPARVPSNVRGASALAMAVATSSPFHSASPGPASTGPPNALNRLLKEDDDADDSASDRLTQSLSGRMSLAATSASSRNLATEPSWLAVSSSSLTEISMDAPSRHTSSTLCPSSMITAAPVKSISSAARMFSSNT